MTYFLLYFRNNEEYIKTSVEIPVKKLKREKACDSPITIEKQANVGAFLSTIQSLYTRKLSTSKPRLGQLIKNDKCRKIRHQRARLMMS